MPRHSLLRRQLKRHFGDPDTVPAEWRAFVDAVDQAYRQSDTDRLMIERSLDLSSEELGTANAQMRDAVSALQRAHLELESRVADRTRELTEANASLRRAHAEQLRLEDELRQAHKMEAVGRLAGGVAHDFNNLLVVIVGQAEVLLRTDTDEVRRASLREILQSAESAATLTRQLLVFSRRQMLSPTVLDLNALVQTTSVLLRRLIGEHIDLTLDLGDGTGWVLADAGQLQQVLLNLGTNARDAMPHGGTITVTTSSEHVDVPPAGSTLAPGPYAVLTVTDTGIGMDAEVKARIFEPFFTTKTQARGTGLGLATAYGIVTQSKGYLEVISEPGTGATFRAWLPQVPPPAPVAAVPVAAVPEAPSVQPTAGIVLVAEDQEPVRRTIRGTLEHGGYTVFDAADGVEALALSHSIPHIDLLISDLVMPRMGGRALAEQLAAGRPGLKVIYMTGYANDAEVAREVREGSRLILTKPFRAAALLATVREALSSPAAISRRATPESD